MKANKNRTFGLAVVLFSFSSWAAGEIDINDVSLEDLLDQKVEVVTRTSLKTSEAPGVVTVLSRDEMIATGGNDLMQVLQLVAGFTLHSDVEGAVGFGFRGLWGNEGKVLLMIDGIEMNEMLYSGLMLDQHFLLDNIDRIEIIRGPGSAVYGGTACLAVINVVTRTGKNLQGGEIGTRLSVSRNSLVDRSLGIALGQYDEKKDLDVSITGYTAALQRNFGPYTDFYGSSVNLTGDSSTNTSNVNFALSYKGFKTRLMFDDYALVARVGLGAVENGDAAVHSRMAAADVRYSVNIRDNLKLLPRATYVWHAPWENSNPNSSFFYSKAAGRLTLGTGLSWQPLQELEVLLGVEFQWDRGWLLTSTLSGLQTDFGGKPAVNYYNGAAYAQALWNTRWVNVAVGARFEMHSQYHGNFAPRIALNRSFGPTFAKLLYSGAFRSPGIENINVGIDIKPERAHVVEAELGWHVTDWFDATLNGFWILLQRPIIYRYDAVTNVEGYINGSNLASAGTEAELVLKGRHGHVRASYSLAVSTENQNPELQNTLHSNRNLAFPNHKLTLFGQWKATEYLRFGGQVLYLSEREAYIRPTDLLDGTGAIGTLPSTWTLTAWAGVSDWPVKGFTGQLGMSNILNTEQFYAQPYNGGSAPLGTRPRELFMRLSYALDFLK